MNRVLLLLLIIFYLNPIFSQNRVELNFSKTSLEKVFAKIEKKFDVKYSYVDSVVVDKQITLVKQKYTLEEINNQLEKQTKLFIIQLSERYYSVSNTELFETKKRIQLNEILVESFLINGIQKSNQKFIIFPKKTQILAGVTDTDVMLSLQQLPSVKSPNETATGLNIRGGNADQNLILFDGIRLYHPGHLFGMISGINSNIVHKVSFYNKAINPKYGEKIASVIELETSDILVDKPKAVIGMNALNTDVFVQIPLLKKKIDIQFSARKSFTELLQSYTFNQLANKVFQNTDFKSFNNINKFRFHDYTYKILFKPSNNSCFAFTGLAIDNNLNYKFKTANENISNQEMKIFNNGLSANWDKKYSAHFSHKLLLYYSVYDFRYFKQNSAENSNEFEAFKKLNRIVNSGADLNLNLEINKYNFLDFGYQISGYDVSHLFNTYNQDIGIDLNLTHFYTITHAAFCSYSFKKNDWNLQAGMRTNYFSAMKTIKFEPRTFLQKKLNQNYILQFSFDRKNQQISQIRENAANDLSLENYVWVLADNKRYPIQASNQFTSGILFKKNKWLVDLDAFFKSIVGITSFNYGILNPDNSIKKGKGFVKGMDLFIQKEKKSWRTSLTYSVQDSQNKFEDLNKNDYFKSSSNITHAVNFNFNKSWSDFSVALAWFWHTGKPYSIVDSSGQITSFNQNNLPQYHRVDLSFDYSFSTEKTKFKTGFSVYNIYNRKSLISIENTRKYATISDFSNPRYEKQEFYSLGITPNIFMRMSF